MIPEKDLAPFVANHNKTRKAIFITSIGSLVLAGGMWFLPSQNSLSTKLTVMATFLAIGAGLLGYQFLMSDPKFKDALQKLQEGYAEVVWIYAERNIANQAHTHTTFFLHRLDGTTFELEVQGPNEGAAMDCFAQWCPALWNNHEEYQPLFNQNPEELRRLYQSQQQG